MHIHSFYIFKINFNVILPHRLAYSTRSHSLKCHHKNSLGTFLLPHFFCTMTQPPVVVRGLLIIEDSRSHSDTPHSVGLLWASNRPDAEISTWQHTTLTTDSHPCPRQDSNPQSQQASDRRPTPRTAWSPKSALFPPYLSLIPLSLSFDFI